MQPITSLDYEQFLADELGDPDRAKDLYARACAVDSTPKVILHQTARLVSLADWMDKVAPARPALKILFLIILAEAAAKMAFGFHGSGESRAYVRRFFAELCLPADRDLLGAAFRGRRGSIHSLLSPEEAVDVLYSVRNSVAHRGEYFAFNLREPGDTATITSYEGGTLQAQITAQELRGIVVRGAVAGAESLLPST